MEITIRKAEVEDMPKVLNLIKELAVYEKEPEAVEIEVEDLIENGFGENQLFYCYVAEIDKEIRGMALFYFRYSTWKGRTVHLEDLIVEEKYRNKGLGKALYKKVVEFAAEKKVKRIEWAVLDWNYPAINFYEKTGATILKDWYVVQFNEQSYLDYLKNYEKF